MRRTRHNVALPAFVIALLSVGSFARAQLAEGAQGVEVSAAVPAGPGLSVTSDVQCVVDQMDFTASIDTEFADQGGAGAVLVREALFIQVDFLADEVQIGVWRAGAWSRRQIQDVSCAARRAAARSLVVWILRSMRPDDGTALNPDVDTETAAAVEPDAAETSVAETSGLESASQLVEPSGPTTSRAGHSADASLVANNPALPSAGSVWAWSVDALLGLGWGAVDRQDEAPSYRVGTILGFTYEELLIEGGISLSSAIDVPVAGDGVAPRVSGVLLTLAPTLELGLAWILPPLLGQEWSASLGGGVFGSALFVQGQGLPRSDNAWSLHYGLSLRATLQWLLAPGLGIMFRPELRFPLTNTDFVVEELGVLSSTGPIEGWFLIGLHFF